MKGISRKKAITIILATLLVLGILYYFFVYRGLTDKIRQKEGVDPTLPTTVNGPWKTYTWNHTRYAYPPEWRLMEVVSDPNEGMVEEKVVSSFRLIPPNPKTKDDFIAVGGGENVTCETLHFLLCVGSEPVYTNSRTPEITIVFNQLIKSIKHLDGTTS